MTAIQACEYVKQNGVSLIRRRSNPTSEYDVKPYHVGGRKKGFIYLDIMSASAVLTVYEAVNEQNKRKMESQDLLRLVDIAWKLVKIG